MSNVARRDFLRIAPGILASTHCGLDKSLIHQPESRMNSALKHIEAGVLDVAYWQAGPARGTPVVLLHGFPYDAHAYSVAAEALAAAGKRVIVPFLRGYGSTRFVSSDTSRVGQQAALGADLLALLDALQIDKATLAGYDWGGRAACVVAALHPARVRGLVSCGTAYNIQSSAKALEPADPEKEHRHWYWFYLASQRGELSLTRNRSQLCRHLWRTFSPTWSFDDVTYARSAASFENPDFVPVVLHSYRYRIGAVAGDSTLDDVENRLSASPKISVPTIALAGADDGVDPPADANEVAKHFTALRRLTVLAGVGHNVPQEAPEAFVRAVLEVETDPR